jgi:hemin uptake protein HemP
MSPLPDNDSAKNNSAQATSMQGRTIRITDGRLDSRDLFVGTREVIISHGNERYRLRLTAQNKLILTK